MNHFFALNAIFHLLYSESAKSGYQKLNGQQAEWLVRFRHNNDGTTYPLSYGDNDIGRMRTQREFIKETLKQTLKPENIFNINKIAQIAFKNIQTNMNFNTVKDYIPYAVNFNTENLKTETLPGTSELANGVWIYNIDKKQVTTVIKELFKDEEIENQTEENNNTNTTSKETTNQSTINNSKTTSNETTNSQKKTRKSKHNKQRR